MAWRGGEGREKESEPASRPSEPVENVYVYPGATTGGLSADFERGTLRVSRMQLRYATGDAFRSWPRAAMRARDAYSPARSLALVNTREVVSEEVLRFRRRHPTDSKNAHRRHDF